LAAKFRRQTIWDRSSGDVVESTASSVVRSASTSGRTEIGILAAGAGKGVAQVAPQA
jgi:hypothetical protein